MIAQDSRRTAYEVPPSARQIDRACDRFEAAYRAGRAPRIEDYLPEVDASLRRPLLRELLMLEIELSSGPAPDRSAYRARFPRDADIVDAALAESTRESPPRGPASRLVSPTIGPHVVVARIGEDRQAVAYRVLGTGLGRELLVRWARAPRPNGPSPDAPQALEEIGRRLAAIDHPNLVRVVDVGEHAGRPYVAMEDVAGVDLARHLEQKRPSPRAAATIAADLAAAVACLHGRGLVHGDIRARNVRIGADGRARLLVSTPTLLRPDTPEGRAADLDALHALLPGVRDTSRDRPARRRRLLRAAMLAALALLGLALLASS